MYSKSKRSENKLNSKNREIESVNCSVISVPPCQEVQRKKSINTDIHNQITADDS
jgi:hypothetical protein